MDADFYASRVSSKHFNSGNHVLLDNSEVKDDDARTYFTCPFCYVDTELSILCNHLQEEHCFDVNNADWSYMFCWNLRSSWVSYSTSKSVYWRKPLISSYKSSDVASVATRPVTVIRHYSEVSLHNMYWVCPVCALNLGKDVIEHFKVHHASSIKARRWSQKSGLWSYHAGRSSIGDLSTENASEHVNGSAPDPLLSPFLFSIPYSETETDTKGNQSQDSCYHEDVSSINEAESSKTSMVSRIEGKEDSEELRQRAALCQHLILSTIF